jgi:hypothetical protein
MKTVIFVLSVLFLTAVFQPGVSVSFAQNCVCAECNYPCKTPMVHASNCKYNNGRSTENTPEINSETKSFNKSADTEATDIEYELLLIHSKVRFAAGDASAEKTGKSKILLEQKRLLGKLTPENETQKMLYDKIIEDLETALKALETQ